ncbi:MAG: enolase C-terminal domain-like protein, partial [Acidimicrobiales bacterium]
MLESLELVRLRLPLRDPWVTALGTITERDVLLLRAVVDGVAGWGECVAQPEPTYSAEYEAGAAAVIDTHLAPRLLAAGPSSAADVAPALGAVKGHPMAKAALELAFLDAELRRDGRNLADDLWSRSATTGHRPAAVPAGVAVGATGSVGALVDEVAGRVAEGYARVKLKIHPGWDIEPVAAVRDRFPEVALQVDANGSYGSLGPVEGSRRLRPLDGYRLLMIEQPLGDDDLLGHAELARHLATP